MHRRHETVRLAPAPVGQRPRKPLRAAPRTTLPPRRTGEPARTLARASPDRAVAPVTVPAVAPVAAPAPAPGGTPIAPLLIAVLLGGAGGFLLGRTLAGVPVEPRASAPADVAPAPEFPDVALAVVPDADAGRTNGGGAKDGGANDEETNDEGTIDEGAIDEGAIDVDALVLENRELAAEVEALESETTDLHGELLALELRVAALSAPKTPGPGATLADTAGAEAGDTGAADAGIGDVEEPDDLAEPVVGASAGTFLPNMQPEAAGRTAATAPRIMPVERLVVTDSPYGSVAGDAGMLPGDVLLRIDGAIIGGFADLAPYEAEPGTRLYEIELLRDGQPLVLMFSGTPRALSLRVEWFDPRVLGL